MRKGLELRQRLKDGRPVYGLLHALASTTAAEMAALAGYDAVIIDAEHGPGGRSTQLSVAQAIAAGGAACLMRLASHDPISIGHALDLGVDGLLVPSVETAAEAAAIVAACCYPPEGLRGYGLGMARASGYGLFAKDYEDDARKGLFLCVIIESVAGVNQASAIANTAGIDAVIVGLHDLSSELGVSGDLGHSSVQDALVAVETAVLAAGKAIGAAIHPGTTLEKMLERGHRFITLGADTRLLGQAMRQQLEHCPDRMRNAFQPAAA